MFLQISIFKFLVKPILWFSHFLNDNYFVLICKGYDDDFENFTGIYWRDDKENCLNYEEYNLLISFR